MTTSVEAGQYLAVPFRFDERRAAVNERLIAGCLDLPNLFPVPLDTLSRKIVVAKGDGEVLPRFNRGHRRAHVLPPAPPLHPPGQACTLRRRAASPPRTPSRPSGATSRQAAAASREARPGVRAEPGMCEHGRWRENCVTCVLAPGEGPVPAAVQEGARRRQRDQEVAGIVFRHRPGGRPTVPAVEQKLKARDRQRAYRARRRSAVRSA